jgi:hypothetical protein
VQTERRIAASEAFCGGTDVAAGQASRFRKVTVEKRIDGKYFFALTFRGVTYPVKGSVRQSDAGGGRRPGDAQGDWKRGPASLQGVMPAPSPAAHWHCHIFQMRMP